MNESEDKQYEITLKFYLPDNKSQAWCALNGEKMWMLLWEIDQRCKAKLKYGDDMAWSSFVVSISDMIYAEIDLDGGNG